MRSSNRLSAMGSSSVSFSVEYAVHLSLRSLESISTTTQKNMTTTHLERIIQVKRIPIVVRQWSARVAFPIRPKLDLGFQERLLSQCCR